MDNLRETLTDLIQRAQGNPGVPQRATLKEDLRLDVMIFEDRAHLQLSHPEMFPGVIDYHEVLDYWPDAVDRPTPKATIHSGRKYLTATLPTPALSLEEGS